MNNSKFTYQDIPSEILPELKAQFEPFAWLVPSWCQHIFISWNTDGGDGAAMSLRTHYEYRWASLTVYPCFHEQPDKKELICHELIHAFSAVLWDFSRDTIKSLVPEDESPKFKKHLMNELRARNESMVQDLAFAIMQHLMASE